MPRWTFATARKMSGMALVVHPSGQLRILRPSFRDIAVAEPLLVAFQLLSAEKKNRLDSLGFDWAFFDSAWDADLRQKESYPHHARSVWMNSDSSGILMTLHGRPCLLS
jgi:hypothetical protein